MEREKNKQKRPKWTKSDQKEVCPLDRVLKVPQPVDADHRCAILSKGVISVGSAGDGQPVGGAASSYLGDGT